MPDDDTIKKHMAIWDAVDDIPEQFTEKFKRGGFRGTATTPMYLFQLATEMWGPIGYAWGFEIVNDDVAPTLKLVKTVTNHDGGLKVAADWTLSATAGGNRDFSYAGDADVFKTVYSNAGYVLDETTVNGYTNGAWTCDGGTLVESPAGVLMLVDMFGGTPSNLCLSFLDERRVEVVTGVNLPMLVKVARVDEGMPLNEVAELARDHGRRNISVASDVLAGGERSGGSS